MDPYRDIAELYHWEYRNWREDLEFYTSVANERKGPVLELACGTGRISCPLAVEGFSVTGIDISLPMLSIAEEERKHLSSMHVVDLVFLRGDMRAFSLRRKYRYILVPFSSFAFLTTRVEQEDCLDRIRESLLPDGILILDLFAPRYEDWGTPATPRRFVKAFFADVGDHGLELVNKFERFARDPYSGILRITTVYERYYYRESPLKVETVLPLAMFTPREVELLLEKSGFSIIDCFGDYGGKPYDKHSPRMIFMAARG
jgi:SAM-dependent methyltransferase